MYVDVYVYMRVYLCSIHVHVTYLCICLCTFTYADMSLDVYRISYTWPARAEAPQVVRLHGIPEFPGGGHRKTGLGLLDRL